MNQDVDMDEDPPAVLNLPTFIAIEHPGQVRSIERAIEGLGGQAALNRLADDPINAPLELRFRPSNRFEHPIQASSAKTSNLVIKVKRTRDSQGVSQLQHEAVGSIKCTRRFRDICDFQWTTKNSPFVNRLEKFVGMNDASEMAQFSLGPEEDPRSNDLDIVPPPVFSTTVVQHAYNYKQNPAARKMETSTGLRYVNRTRGLKMHLLTTGFEDASVPVKPSQKLSTTPTAEIQSIIEKLQVLFEERPMWTRRGLVDALGDKSMVHSLKFAIPYVAYMWKSGPWRDCYVKFGLDPRSDNMYAKYQAIYCLYTQSQTLEGVRDIKPVASHIFDGRTLFPSNRTFMFIDMTDPLLTQMWQRAPMRPTPHERDGWYYSNMINAARRTLKAKITALWSGTIPSDLEFTDMLRQAGEPDAVKGEVVQSEDKIDDDGDVSNDDDNDDHRRRVPDFSDSSNSDDIEDDTVTDGDDDDDDDDDNDDDEMHLSQRVDTLVDALMRPDGDPSRNADGDHDAFPDIDNGIFGSESE